MQRLIITGVIALAITGLGTDRVLHGLDADPAGIVLTATGGPAVPYNPKPDPPCANDTASAESAVKQAQKVLRFDHHEARISASQLTALGDDLNQETNAAEGARNWRWLCAEIGQVEGQATSE